MFCTYAHYTPQGTLFYIGKGSNERRPHYFEGRNNYWNKVVAKYGKPKVEVLAKWQTETEAFEHEKLLITCFRDLGFKLCNITDGGNGLSGYKQTAAHKLKLSKAKLGKPAWNKGLKGLKSWNKGVPCRDETKQKLRAANLGKRGAVMPETAKAKISLASIGNTKSLRYKLIGTNVQTGQESVFLGNKALAAAGFSRGNVNYCIKGERKTHNGYTWRRELLENK